MRGQSWRWASVALVSALLLAACSDVEEGGGGGDEAGGGDGGATVARCGSDPIRIAVNPWTGSAVNANVAKVIMEQEMGCTVQLVEIDEFAQFPALAQGDLEATLEVWPSGHAEDYATYIEGDGSVVDGGELGVIGNIGWFVPAYLVEENPELATWEGLKGNEAMFATAETGNQGQFLAGDPSFVSYDEEIIENLGLDLKVVYSGSEAALLTALDAAYAKQDPLLMYFWSPHWAQAKYALTEVELPAYDAECEDAALNRDGDGYACDYADDILYKAFTADLEERDPAAFAFLSAMSYTNEDQNSIALAIDDGGLSPEEAARQWVDEHEDVWSAWLPTAG
jgi:glycine betaine/proline transport system substrate-binding protein